MHTEKEPEHPGKFPDFALIATILVLSAVSLACLWFPEFIFLPTRQGNTNNNQPIREAQQPGAGSGDVQICNALGEVTITLADFSEGSFTEADGSPSGQECAYSYQVEITGSVPVILIYFDHYCYGSNPPPNDYEFGWN
jgi:hypothetical protein